MSTLPLTESILLEIHQSLGCPSYPSIKKEKFATGQASLAAHEAMGKEILEAIFEALDMDPQACLNAIHNLTEFGNSYKTLELNTWTFAADDCQIIWMVLGYYFAPVLARHAAFWNLEEPLDQGMPGGRFWYLPEPTKVDGMATLYLPVAQVVDWLLDLLGMPLEKFADERSEATLGAHDGLRRSLYNWRKGTTISRDSLRKYFSDSAKLNFEGAFTLDSSRSPAEQFDDALAFVSRKNLTAEQLRLEIPMTQQGRLEAILEKRADQEERAAFVACIAKRYAVPSSHTIRQRLLFARMVQDGYKRLLEYLCPGVDPLCSDARQNKLLQLFALYKLVYNLTVGAYRNCGDRGEAAENAWFEEQLAPVDQHGLFLAILPSRRETGMLQLSYLLTRLFHDMQPGAPLEDHFGLTVDTAQPIAERNAERAVAIGNELIAESQLVDRMTRSSPWRALQGEHRYWVVSQVAQNEDLSAKAKEVAIQRLRELSTTPGQAVQVILLELDSYLNADCKHWPNDTRQRVQALLDEAEASEGYELWKALLLQYKAKHLLACNDLEGAGRCFREALEAAKERNYGRLRGEIARDCLAMAVANQKLIPNNHEKYYREMLAGGMVENASLPSIEDTARWAADYFWSTLYKSYPGTERLAPLAGLEYKESLRLLMAGNQVGLIEWIQRNRRKLNNPLPMVSADSLVMSWIKALSHFKKQLPRMRHMAPSKEALEDFEKVLTHWHEGIRLLAQHAPKQLNIADFKGQTPLMLAAESGDIVLVKLMLQNGADPDLQDCRGMTALHSAITSRVDSCVDALLDHPCAVDKNTDEGQSPLHTAAWTGNRYATRRLVNLEPRLAWKRNSQGMTPLEQIKHLIENPCALQVLAKELDGRECPSKQDLEVIVPELERAIPLVCG
jgi:hypothetical protein